MSLIVSHGISAGLASVVLIVLTGLSEAPRLIKSGIGFPSVSGGTLVYLAAPTRFTGSLASIDLPERKHGSAAVSAKLEKRQRDSLLKQRLRRGALHPIEKRRPGPSKSFETTTGSSRARSPTPGFGESRTQSGHDERVVAAPTPLGPLR